MDERSVVDAVDKVRAEERAQSGVPTADSFQNFVARVGLGTNNQSSDGTYGFNPITRQRTKLEWMYRGSWLARAAVECIAEDMTREWITITSSLDPGAAADLNSAMVDGYEIPSKLNETIKWARLYGGAGAAMLIDGQDPSEPLRAEAIAPNSFNGLLVLDRWMLEPSLSDLVTDQKDLDLGKPKYYTVTADAPALPRMRIHHTRFLRFDGSELPYWQRLTENLWGLSILEPLYDRLLAFDSTTQGIAQLVYKAHLRTMKVTKLRELIANGGRVYEAFLQQMQLIRTFQTNEGLTLLDAEDEFETHQYSFGGLSDVLARFEEQLAGATETPLVRLFGMSPGGLNSTGESDLNTYYDGVKNKQERKLRPCLGRLIPVVAQSEGIKLPEDFAYDFVPLWQMKDPERANYASTVTSSVVQAKDAGIVTPATALKELKQSAAVSGIWTNVTDEDIEEAENAPPVPDMPMMPEEGFQEPEEADAGDLGPQPMDARIGDQIYAHIGGLPITIETPKGTARTGRGWSVIAPADYGYVSFTKGADGDAVDCYVGPHRDSPKVWLIDQVDAETGEFDEHKCMLGYVTRSAALNDYLAGFSDGKGPQRIGGVKAMPMDQFKVWLADRHVVPRSMVRAA